MYHAIYWRETAYPVCNLISFKVIVASTSMRFWMTWASSAVKNCFLNSPCCFLQSVPVVLFCFKILWTVLQPQLNISDSCMHCKFSSAWWGSESCMHCKFSLYLHWIPPCISSFQKIEYEYEKEILQNHFVLVNLKFFTVINKFCTGQIKFEFWSWDIINLSRDILNLSGSN